MGSIDTNDVVNGDADGYAMGDSAQRGDQAIFAKPWSIRIDIRRSSSRPACVCCAVRAEIPALSLGTLTEEQCLECCYFFTK